MDDQPQQPWDDTIGFILERKESVCCLTPKRCSDMLALHARMQELEEARVLLKETIKRGMTNEKKLLKRITELQAQWTKTNAEYERVSKEHSRLVSKFAELEVEIARLREGES